MDRRAKTSKAKVLILVYLFDNFFLIRRPNRVHPSNTLKHTEIDIILSKSLSPDDQDNNDSSNTLVHKETVRYIYFD